MNADQRAALLTAAATVAGITGHTKMPPAPARGDAWTRWRGAERGDGFLFVNTWAVIVTLDADDQAADDYADQIGYPLATALEAVMYVDAITPTALATSAGDIKCLTITGRSE